MKIGDGARALFSKREGKVEVVVGDMVGVRETTLAFYHKDLLEKVDYLTVEHNSQLRDKEAIKKAERDAKKSK